MDFAFLIRFWSVSTEITFFAFVHNKGVKIPKPVPNSKTTSFFEIFASEIIDCAIEFELRKCCPNSLRFIIALQKDSFYSLQ